MPQLTKYRLLDPRYVAAECYRGMFSLRSGRPGLRRSTPSWCAARPPNTSASYVALPRSGASLSGVADWRSASTRGSMPIGGVAVHDEASEPPPPSFAVLTFALAASVPLPVAARFATPFSIEFRRRHWRLGAGWRMRRHPMASVPIPASTVSVWTPPL